MTCHGGSIMTGARLRTSLLAASLPPLWGKDRMGVSRRKGFLVIPGALAWISRQSLKNLADAGAAFDELTRSGKDDLLSPHKPDRSSCRGSSERFFKGGDTDEHQLHRPPVRRSDDLCGGKEVPGRDGLPPEASAHVQIEIGTRSREGHGP